MTAAPKPCLNFAFDFEGRLPVSAQLGMAQADENANEKWKAIYDACVLATARKRAEITSDDVLSELESLPNPPSTHNLSAIGPAMLRAQELGIIRATEKIVRSTRKEKRGNLHRVWASNQYRGDRP